VSVIFVITHCENPRTNEFALPDGASLAEGERKDENSNHHRDFVQFD
jgi:hypothetical protein